MEALDGPHPEVDEQREDVELAALERDHGAVVRDEGGLGAVQAQAHAVHEAVYILEVRVADRV